MFSRENVARVREMYKDKARTAQKSAESRLDELYSKIDSLYPLDRELSLTGAKIMKAAMDAGDVASSVEKLRAHVSSLKEQRRELLEKNGYPADYSAIKYECDKCSDTGFVGTKMCSCMRRALIEATYESSGISHLIKKQDFSNFSLDYYKDHARSVAERNARKLYSFAEGFSADTYTNYLLIGATGLGKTHLSTAVAKAVIKRGYDVAYDTAQGVMSAFEIQRFGTGEAGDGTTERYFDCDLLIIDDLGTEIKNQFTSSCVYNIVNTRINREKCTIINTNLERSELRDRYNDAITSRLFGEYCVLVFEGSDIRRQKI